MFISMGTEKPVVLKITDNLRNLYKLWWQNVHLFLFLSFLNYWYIIKIWMLFLPKKD
jgi:hypothetical protein